MVRTSHDKNEPADKQTDKRRKLPSCSRTMKHINPRNQGLISPMSFCSPPSLLAHSSPYFCLCSLAPFFLFSSSILFSFSILFSSSILPYSSLLFFLSLLFFYSSIPFSSSILLSSILPFSFLLPFSSLLLFFNSFLFFYSSILFSSSPLCVLS